VEQTTVSSRIPEKLGVDLDRAADERHVFRSEIIKRALRYCVEQDPDNIQSLDDTGSRSIGTVNSLHGDKKPNEAATLGKELLGAGQG